jgi:hypothetical protein
MDDGNIAMILNPFLDGMKEAGAKVELFYIKEDEKRLMQRRYEAAGLRIQENAAKMMTCRCSFLSSKRLMSLFGQVLYTMPASQVLSKKLMDRQLPLFMQENTRSKKQKAVLHLRSLGVVHVRSAPGANEGYLR